MRLFTGLARLTPPGTTYEIAEVNGQPALIVRVDGKPFSVMTFETEAERVKTVRVVANPDKLARL